ADQMNDMLHSVVEYGTGTKANIFPKVWGKTGTTQDDRDAWWIGFTPELTTTVWAGNDHYLNAMDSVHGGSLCAGAWDDFMKVGVPLMQRFHADNSAEMMAALANQPGEHSSTTAGSPTAGALTSGAVSSPSAARVKVKICLDSGLLATATCPRTAFRSFASGTQPTQSCPLDHSSDESQIYICPVSGKLATQYCPNPILKSFPSDKAPTQFCDVHRGPG
ncbi:MAG: hypothetical protein LC772_11385, partial [Chloroflexi bacterium]|nr:hypothetical protein [Chloroflexota bacterium]